VDEGKQKVMKDRLDELHLEKIAMSDETRFVVPGAYFGESTTKELKAAAATGVPVSFTIADKDLPEWVSSLLKERGYSSRATPLGGVWIATSGTAH